MHWPFSRKKEEEQQLGSEEQIPALPASEPVEQAVAVAEPEPEPMKFSEISLETVGDQDGAEGIVMAEYLGLARKVGFCPGPVLEKMICHFLNREGLKIYNYAEVDKFLDGLYGGYVGGQKSEQKPGWVWRPLTISDQEKELEYSNYDKGWSGNIDNRRVYDYEIPLHILRIVAKLKEEIPEAAVYVSDADVPGPDPFIMVSGDSMDDYVFGHWQEPDFGLKNSEG